MTFKDLLDFFLSVVIVGLAIQCLALNQELKNTTSNYDKKLEVQRAEYRDTVIDLKQELLAAKFELNMAKDHIELLNAENEVVE